MAPNSLRFTYGTLLLLGVGLLWSTESNVSAWRPSPSRPILSSKLRTKRNRSNASRTHASTTTARYNNAAVRTRGGASPALPPMSDALPVSVVPSFKAMALWTAVFTLWVAAVTSSKSVLSLLNSLAILVTGWTIAYIWFFYSIFASDPGTPEALMQSKVCATVAVVAFVGGCVGALSCNWSYVLPVILLEFGFLGFVRAVSWYRKSRPR
jgi:hypothetical protein